MPTLSTVVLTTKGEFRKANLQLNESNELSLENIQKYFKKRELPEQLCYYEYDNKLLFVFGYSKGKKGTENKTELLDPYSDVEFFGDAIVVASLSSKWSQPIPLTVDSWNAFYNKENDDAEDDDTEDNEDVEDDESEQEEEEEQEDDEKDDDEKEDDEDLADDEEVDEEPEIQQPVKRRRAPVYAKVDTSAFKEDIVLNSEPETNKLRMLCLKSLSFLEASFSKESIRELEKGIFEATYNNAQKNYIPCTWKSQNFVELYRQFVRTILSNIHPQSPVKNPRLLHRVLDGEFTLASIPSMTTYEMFPENWFALKDKLLQREQKILEGNKSRATDQFKCRRCQKRECTFYELQTRSADEPMTIFITCLNCGKEWRQGG